MILSCQLGIKYFTCNKKTIIKYQQCFSKIADSIFNSDQLAVYTIVHSVVIIIQSYTITLTWVFLLALCVHLLLILSAHFAVNTSALLGYLIILHFNSHCSAELSQMISVLEIIIRGGTKSLSCKSLVSFKYLHSSPKS